MSTNLINSTQENFLEMSQSADRLQRLITEMSVEFISILDLDALIDRVAQRLRQVIDYKFFNLFLVDELRGGLAWKKAVGYNSDEVAAHEVIPFDHSIASAAWREGQTINVGDVSRDSRYLPIASEDGNPPRSEIAVPLILARENKIDFDGRKGYVKAAINAGVPIVPMVGIGGQETQIFLTRGEKIAKALGPIARAARAKVVPLSIGLPFGLSAVLPFNVPLPSKIVMQVLPPVDPTAIAFESGDEPDIDAVDAHVRKVMQDALDELAEERRFPVLG